MRYSLYRYSRKSTGSVFYCMTEFYGDDDPEWPGRKEEGWKFDGLWSLEDGGQFEQEFIEQPWPVEITLSDLV